MDTMTASHDGQAEVAMVCFFSSCFLPTWQCYLLFKVIVGVHIPAVMFLARPIPPCSLPMAAATCHRRAPTSLARPWNEWAVGGMQ